MRPKKNILYICANDRTLSWRSYGLMLRGYRVIKANDIEQLPVFAEFDLVLIEMQYISASNDLAKIVQGVAPDVPILIIGKTHRTPAYLAVPFIPDDAPPVELFSVVRTMITRKRGPKKRPAVEVGA